MGAETVSASKPGWFRLLLEQLPLQTTFIIARLTFREAARRRILLAALILGLVFLAVVCELMIITAFFLKVDKKLKTA